jgi:predicted molibdopterin-dependent oxidoreductase YjgC
LARLADVQLPAAVCAEKEGTFTNVRGRVQRFSAAVPPIGEALPDLDILEWIAAEAGAPIAASPPAETFRQLAQCVEAFAGMTYESIGAGGQLIRES